MREREKEREREREREREVSRKNVREKDGETRRALDSAERIYEPISLAAAIGLTVVDSLSLSLAHSLSLHLN